MVATMLKPELSEAFTISARMITDSSSIQQIILTSLHNICSFIVTSWSQYINYCFILTIELYRGFRDLPDSFPKIQTDLLTSIVKPYGKSDQSPVVFLAIPKKPVLTGDFVESFRGIDVKFVRREKPRGYRFFGCSAYHNYPCWLGSMLCEVIKVSAHWWWAKKIYICEALTALARQFLFSCRRTVVSRCL